MHPFVISLTLFSLISCVTIDNYGPSTFGSVDIDCIETSETYQKKFMIIKCVLENNSTDDHPFVVTTIEPSSGKDKFKITTSEKIASLIKEKPQRGAHESPGTLLGGTALRGIGSSSNNGSSIAALLVVGAAIGVSLLNEAAAAKPIVFSDHHLLNNNLVLTQREKTEKYLMLEIASEDMIESFRMCIEPSTCKTVSVKPQSQRYRQRPSQN